MLTLSTVSEQWDDNWTIVTADRSRTAQFGFYDRRDRMVKFTTLPESFNAHRPACISRFDGLIIVNGLHFPVALFTIQVTGTAWPHSNRRYRRVMVQVAAASTSADPA